MTSTADGFSHVTDWLVVDLNKYLFRKMPCTRVRVCVCVYLHEHVCVYVCVCVFECFCMWVCLCMCEWACVCVCVCIHICVCVYVFVHVCVLGEYAISLFSFVRVVFWSARIINACNTTTLVITTYTHAHTHARTHANTHTRIHTHLRTYKPTCTSTHSYTNKQRNRFSLRWYRCGIDVVRYGIDVILVFWRGYHNVLWDNRGVTTLCNTICWMTLCCVKQAIFNVGHCVIQATGGRCVTHDNV